MMKEVARLGAFDGVAALANHNHGARAYRVVSLFSLLARVFVANLR